MRSQCAVLHVTARACLSRGGAARREKALCLRPTHLDPLTVTGIDTDRCAPTGSRLCSTGRGGTAQAAQACSLRRQQPLRKSARSQEPGARRKHGEEGAQPAGLPRTSAICGGAVACRATAAVPLKHTPAAPTKGAEAPANRITKSSSPTSACSFSICEKAGRGAGGHGQRCHTAAPRQRCKTKGWQAGHGPSRLAAKDQQLDGEQGYPCSAAPWQPAEACPPCSWAAPPRRGRQRPPAPAPPPAPLAHPHTAQPARAAGCRPAASGRAHRRHCWRRPRARLPRRAAQTVLRWPRPSQPAPAPQFCYGTAAADPA